MNLNLSFFKKSAITGTAIALVVGAGMSFFAHASATNNNQVTTHGSGFVVGMNDQENLTKVTGTNGITLPSGSPNVCDSTTQNSSCHCPQVGLLCTRCFTFNGHQFCASCPSNSHMMSVCRIVPGPGTTGDGDNDTDDQGAVVTPTSTGTGTITTNPGSNDSTQPSQPTDTSGGNTTGLDDNTPSTNNTGCNTNPRMMIACRAPGNNSTCPYLEVCRASDN